MKSLSFYVLRQIVGPFLLFLLLMTSVVWLTQSLRLLDLVINRSQSAGMFAYLTMLMLPNLLTVIIPIAFFAGSLYALHRLNSDSELVVMWAAGFSRLQLALPVLLGAAVAMIMTYSCNLFLMPLAERTMRSTVLDIRADIAAAILHEGSFTTPTDGLTVFIRELEPSGEIRGILVHDNRNPDHPVTYIAATGVLVEAPEGTRLIMQNGDVEQTDDHGAKLSVLKFDKYVFNLDQFASPQRDLTLDTSERYLPELLYPEAANDSERRHVSVYLAEAHNRLSSPLYCIAFALMALAATARGRMARSSYALRLIAVSLLAAGLRLAGYGLQGMAVRNPALDAVFYLPPLAAAALAAMSLMGFLLLPAGKRAPVLEEVP